MIGKKTERSLIVRFMDIPQEGMRRDIPLEEGWLMKIAPVGASFRQGIRAEVFIETSGRNVSVSGSITGDVELTCVRCLKTFPFHVNPHFSLVLVPEENSRLHVERELAKEHLDMDVYRNEEVNIEALLVDQIVLSLPSYPRCTEFCKGLCTRCGADLNLGPCGCHPNDDSLSSFRRSFGRLEDVREGKSKRGGR